MKCKVAIASTDQKSVDTHFGRCDTFTIAEFDDENEVFEIVERRPVPAACPSCGTKGDSDDAIGSVIDAISDCCCVVVSKIGRWPDSLLYERGINSIEYSGPIAGICDFLRAKTEGGKLSKIIDQRGVIHG
ncbi:MAG: hypothetical protein LBT23_06560 [Synergistaceae bacterium]|nr:hypothetical protein [Synergistaceae bacterium]